MVVHLRTVRLGSLTPERAEEFPFTVPVVASLAGAPLAFGSEVTFLVGENGSGKSTLLEGIAAAARAITVGSAPAERDPTMRAGQALARALRLEWARRTHLGFFLRAEDFFGFATGLDRMRAELERDKRAAWESPTGSDFARSLAQMPYERELAALRERYGDGLEARSHGEAFLALFQARFVPDGLYLLDEPEAPLSPTRQLALIAQMRGMVERRAQFVVATHSPILMAYPGATIYGMDGGAVRQVPFAEVEHVALTKRFLNDPDSFLRHL